MKFCITLLIGAFGLCLHTGAQETVGRLSESQIALLGSDIQTRSFLLTARKIASCFLVSVTTREILNLLLGSRSNKYAS
jgi:hypothetical protein